MKQNDNDMNRPLFGLTMRDGKDLE
jgi:hypothetical protein